MLSDDDARALINRYKLLDGPMEWRQLPEGSQFLESVINLIDESNISIPNLRVILFHRTSPRIDSCKDQFTLFHEKYGVRTRVIQLEVVETEKKSSVTEAGKLYGPHIHFNEHSEVKELSNDLGCLDHPDWFQVFLQHANLQDDHFTYFPPF